jgi:PAS domain S-box-containing protein
MKSKTTTSETERLKLYTTELENRLAQMETKYNQLKFKHESFFEELNQQNQILASLNEELNEKNDRYAALNQKFVNVIKELNDQNEKLQRSELKLKETQEHFRFVTEQIEEFIYLTSGEGDMLFVAGNTQKLFGISSEKMKSMNIFQLSAFFELDEERKNQIFEKTNTAIQQKSKKVYYDFHVSINGESRWFETTEQLLYDKTGNYNGAIGITNEITARKRNEQSLAESEEKFRAIFEMALDLICIADMEKARFIKVNPAFERKLGYNEKELTNDSYLKFIHPDDLEDTLHTVKTELDKGNTIIHFVNRFRCKDGTYRWLDWKSHSIPEKGITYAIAHDITDMKNTYELLKHQNQELRDAKEKMKESARLKTAFLNNISHEFRTPMNGILGFIDLLLKPETNTDEQKTYAKFIRDSANQLMEVVMDTIEIAQVQSKAVSLNKSKFSLNEIINDTINEIKEKADHKNLQLEMHLACVEEELMLFSDKYKITRIIKHLLDNAIKFTHKGKISLNCRIININQIEIRVSDTGVGISEEMQQVIFQPFRQAVKERSVTYGGNGIGLSLVKAYVDMLEGEIALKSTINKGTSVEVTFPLKLIEEKKPAMDKSSERVNWNHKTIMIVEDEKNNREYIQELLKRNGVSFISAQNGQEAIDLCRNNAEIHMILMDLKMPVMDGYQATSIIKNFRNDIPVIAQTAFALDRDKKLMLSTGFDAYIIKPIVEQDLMNVMSKFLIDKNS